ncbi:hypothetical protein [Streptomyces sp. NPDC059468]|uniref:hypothetical protein n=1 Tax=Streptomyces sp. NPDC059468 TaxID=3346845 RepID=UPI003698368F
MNTIGRDGQDTGEQDVRELRRLHAGGTHTPSVDNVPHVRHKEDVPNEGALADFYGLDECEFPSIHEVKDELSDMVDAGELCMGWDAEQQAFVYWFPEEREVWEEQPLPESAATAHRRKAPRGRRKGFRRALLTVAATVAPLFMGMVAEAALDDHVHHQTNTDPDLADDNWQPQTVHTTPIANTSTLDNVETRPDSDSYARHARPSTSPTVEKPNSYVGRHRKDIGTAVSRANPGQQKKTTSKVPGNAAAAHAKSITAPSASTPRTVPAVPSRHKPKHENPVQEVVNNLLNPVESLL